jgi:predicted transcriptional regulator
MQAQIKLGRLFGVEVGLHYSWVLIAAVKPNTPVTEALETRRREDMNQLPVITEGHLAGIIARSHILQLLEARAELQQV